MRQACYEIINIDHCQDGFCIIEACIYYQIRGSDSRTNNQDKSFIKNISVICQKWIPESKKLHYPGSPNTTLKYTFREIVLRGLAECISLLEIQYTSRKLSNYLPPLDYRIFTSSRPGNYSILDPFVQRSQYSIKFPLQRQFENPWVYY